MYLITVKAIIGRGVLKPLQTEQPRAELPRPGDLIQLPKHMVQVLRVVHDYRVDPADGCHVTLYVDIEEEQPE